MNGKFGKIIEISENGRLWHRIVKVHFYTDLIYLEEIRNDIFTAHMATL